MTERTVVLAGAPLSLGNMIAIDARQIVAGRHGMSLGEMRALRERLGDWLGALNALKENAGREASHCPPCLAFSLCDNIDLTIHDTGIEDAIDALDDQIRDAASAFARVPDGDGNQSFQR